MNFQTPLWVCAIMVSLIPAGVRSVLEPTPGQGNLVAALNGYDVTAPEDFCQLPPGRWDAIVMNPPFSPMPLGYKMLAACMDMSNVIIALMPWFTIINSERRTRAIHAFGLAEVVHLPRRAFPGARVQTCILKMQKGYRAPTVLTLISSEKGTADALQIVESRKPCHQGH